MTKETGTLEELNVQPGDVVEHVLCKMQCEVRESGEGLALWDLLCERWGVMVEESTQQYRIISRASDTPKTWGDMTDAEKGALLLAHHEGKVIQKHHVGKWFNTTPLWADKVAYRIKPEPKRETVEAYGRVVGADKVWVIGEGKADGDTHCITFDTLDGEPVLDSIRMEKIGEGDQ